MPRRQKSLTAKIYGKIERRIKRMKNNENNIISIKIQGLDYSYNTDTIMKKTVISTARPVMNK